MNKGVSIALIVCGSCLAGIIPLRSMLLDWRAMNILSGGGELRMSVESLPTGYAWGLFVLGALMILFGAWTAFRRRSATAASGE